MKRSQITWRPITFDEAARYCADHHLYLRGRVIGCVFSLAALRACRLVGVIMWGRPGNQFMDDILTLQGYRLATCERVKNLGSMMIARSARVARLLGYRRLIAYCRVDFRAVQLRAAGFTIEAENCRARGGESVNRYALKLV